MAAILVVTLILVPQDGAKLCWKFGLLYVKKGKGQIGPVKRYRVSHRGRIILNGYLGTSFK